MSLVRKRWNFCKHQKTTRKRKPSRQKINSIRHLVSIVIKAQLELTLESMLSGSPEVLISADDQRIQQIADQDSVWAASDSQSETKQAPISVVARQSVAWIDTSKQPPSANARIHSIADDRHEHWEIDAAISKSDQRPLEVLPKNSNNNLSLMSKR